MAKTEETIVCATEEQKIDTLKQFIAEINTYEQPGSYLIRVLHKTQSLFGYVPTPVMDIIAHEMGIPTAHIWAVVTFYHYFNLNAPGKYTISVCLGTACHVKGGDIILENFERKLGINEGQTTSDREFSIDRVACVGCCALAPVAIVDETVYGKVAPSKVEGLILGFQIEKEKEERRKQQHESNS